MEDCDVVLKKIALIRTQLDELEDCIKKNASAEKTFFGTEKPTSIAVFNHELELSGKADQLDKKETPEEQITRTIKKSSVDSEPSSALTDERKALLVVSIIGALFVNLLLSAEAAHRSLMVFIEDLPWMYESYPSVVQGFLIQGAVVWVIPAVASLVSYFRKKDYVHTYLVWQFWLLALSIIGLIGKTFR